MNPDRILFLVEYSNMHVITYAFGREEAKRDARDFLGEDPDVYIVTPLTERGDLIRISIHL